MTRSGKRIALIVGAVLLVGATVTAVVLLRSPSRAGGADRVLFDPNRTQALAGRVSEDQLAILSVNGPPQAFALYFDPQSGSTIEEWDYYTLGEEVLFQDGVYQGGIEVPLPEIQEGASIPEPAMYPWEALEDPTPENVVRLAGPALFQTSALVLPGWNDGTEVARLWLLAGGGSMITVDGRLAMVSVDLGESIEEDLIRVSGLYVGTLGEGDDRLGAILSPGVEAATFRLSLSPRGQGTTQDGAEIMLDLEGKRLDQVFLLGTSARASNVDLEGAETPAEASGTITITERDGLVEVRIDASANGRRLVVSGRLASGHWSSKHRSHSEALGQAESPVARRTNGPAPTTPTARSVVPPTVTAAPSRTAPAVVPVAASTSAPAGPEAPSGWQLSFHDPFDSNVHKWATGAVEGENTRYSSELAHGRYEFSAERKEARPSTYIFRAISVDVAPSFHISVEATQTGAIGGGCGIRFAGEGGALSTLFVVSGQGRLIVRGQNDDGTWRNQLDWATSPTIRPGQTNRLSMLGDGSELVLFVNGVQVGGIGKFPVKSVGLVAYTQSSDPVHCSFDNLEIREK